MCSVPPSTLVQASQDSIDALHSAAALWGQVFAEKGVARAQLDSQAEAIAGVFQAFQVAYTALPRFRTEAALRRFMEALQQLERSFREVHAPASTDSIGTAAGAATEAVKFAQAAFSAVSGKPVETVEAPRPVRGAVQRLLGDRGYGFVRATGTSSEIFFTAQSVRGARFGDLRVGQGVSFKVVPDPRVPGRMHAIEVQPLA
jgi:cold shock CspA family protein